MGTRRMDTRRMGDFFNGMEQLSLEEIKEISMLVKLNFLIPIFAKMTILM